MKKGEGPTRKGREGAYSNENERVGSEEIGDGKGGEAILPPPKVLTLENLGGPTVIHQFLHVLLPTIFDPFIIYNHFP